MADFSLHRAFPALKRLAQQASRATEAAQERCELCSELIPHAHRHLLEMTAREVVCACRACSILFDKDPAGGGQYRLIPDRTIALDACDVSDARWNSFHIPVGVAFFLFNSAIGQPVVIYPSPMGPTETSLAPTAWEELQQSHPVLRTMESDVEALLANRARGARQYYLVPIDECYRLVGLVRLYWKGLSGGQDVWRRIETFFSALHDRSRSRGWSRIGTVSP